MTIAEETIETVLKLNDVRAEDLYIRAKTGHLQTSVA